jgi:prepilin-type N-terminal cleavage/methylation domain-containing protein
MRHSRGFTLIELLIALVMMGVVTGGLYAMLIRTQRLTRAQTEQLSLQSTVRSASLVVPSELRELNNVVGAATPGPQVDLVAQAPTSITYRAMRGLGFVCQVTATEIRLLKDQWSAYRDPVATRDAAYIFIENDPNLTSDDAWLQENITGVNMASNCGAGIGAIALTVSPNVTPAQVLIGTPVRTFEVMKLSLYVEGGKSWLGAQSVSGGDPSLQPLLGPLKDDNGVTAGLNFTYLDAAGAVTAVPANVKSIVLTVRGVSQHNMSRSGGSYAGVGTDSLVTQVSLRNAFRP